MSLNISSHPIASLKSFSPTPKSIRTVYLAVLGLGTVGQGLLEILKETEAELLRTQGLKIRLSSLVSRSQRFHAPAPEDALSPSEALDRLRHRSLPQIKASHEDIREILQTTPATIVVELTPTSMEEDPSVAFQTIDTALRAGKHVVTANKEPIARHYPALRETATAHQCQLLIEATVLSGTPLLSLFKYGLQGHQLMQVEGILNGTTNFIISAMEEGTSYKEALLLAQKKGFAESDPSYDVSGKDSMLKVAILCQTLFFESISLESIPYTGIEQLSKEDILAAQKENMHYRLIGRITRIPLSSKVANATQNTADAMPQPSYQAEVILAKLPQTHPLTQVRNALNAVTFTTEFIGTSMETTIIGEGAGKASAASGVFQDILSLATKLD